MAFNWTNDLATGNAQIDSEHQKLIKAVNDLLTACQQGKGRQEIEKTVNFLVDYTKTHFSHEEQLQVKHKYPQYIAHKTWHEGFVKNVVALSDKIKAEGVTIALVGEVNSKASVLITHIKSEDSKLAKFIKENP